MLASVIGTDTRSKRFCRIPYPAACASTYDFAVIRKVATADYGPDWIAKFRRHNCAPAHKAESELGKKCDENRPANILQLDNSCSRTVRKQSLEQLYRGDC